MHVVQHFWHQNVSDLMSVHMSRTGRQLLNSTSRISIARKFSPIVVAG